jgi:hypothetical protein
MLQAQLKSDDPFGLGLGADFGPKMDNKGSFLVANHQGPIDGNLSLLD